MKKKIVGVRLVLLLAVALLTLTTSGCKLFGGGEIDCSIYWVNGWLVPAVSGSGYEWMMNAFGYNDNEVTGEVVSWKLQLKLGSEVVVEINDKNYGTFTCIPTLQTKIYGLGGYFQARFDCIHPTGDFNGKKPDVIVATFEILDRNDNRITLVKEGKFEYR